MRSTESNLTQEIRRYTQAGFSVKSAINQVAALTLGRHSAAIIKIKESIEFDIGDKVTFNPYGKALPAVVMGIRYGSPWVKDDNRVFYELSGPSVLSVTTGKSIKESCLFDNEQG